MNAAAAPAPLPERDEAEAARECWDLLAALHLLHAHIWLGRRDEPTAGLTVILAVDHAQGTLLIDALRDARDLEPGAALYFDTQVEGRRLRFECRLEQIVMLDDGAAYRLVDPRVVLDQQRRNRYRVRLPPTLRLPAAVSGAGKLTQARVLDLSTRGCRTELDTASELERGDAVRLSIRLSGTDLTCNAHVRHVQRLPGAVKLGVEFEVPTQADAHLLEQAVARLQREILRRRQG